MKAVDTLNVLLPNKTATTLVATISSDGKARVYDLARVHKPAPGSKVQAIEPVGEYDSNGSRLVCLALVDSVEKDDVLGKRKLSDNGQEGDGDEEEGCEGLTEESRAQDEDLPLDGPNEP